MCCRVAAATSSSIPCHHGRFLLHIHRHQQCHHSVAGACTPRSPSGSETVEALTPVVDVPTLGPGMHLEDPAFVYPYLSRWQILFHIAQQRPVCQPQVAKGWAATQPKPAVLAHRYLGEILQDMVEVPRTSVKLNHPITHTPSYLLCSSGLESHRWYPRPTFIVRLNPRWQLITRHQKQFPFARGGNLSAPDFSGFPSPL